MRWTIPRGKVLVLAPHPDDESIGCGGAILLHARQGDPVKVVFLSDGAAGDPEGLYGGRDYRALRQTEARRAARVLGVKALEFWDYPDGHLNAAAELPKRLCGLLEKERPDIVYRTASSDPHRDHAALASFFDAGALSGPLASWDCQYDVWSSPMPEAVADISAVFPQKIKAIRQYRSQLRYHDYPSSVRRLNASRGLFLPGAKYAEAFRIARPATETRGASSMPRENAAR